MTNENENKPKRGRPPGSTTKPIIDRLEDYSDEKLLDWVRNGKEVVMQGPGGPVTVRRDLTAAEMDCILKRIRQIRTNPRRMPLQDGAVRAHLLEEARKRGFGGGGYKFAPPASAQPDDEESDNAA